MTIVTEYVNLLQHCVMAT